MVKRFSDLNIPAVVALEGKKVKIASVLCREIIILAYSLRPSKYKDNTMYAKIQFNIPNKSKKYVLFTGSTNIIRQLEMIKPEDFPIAVTIIKHELGYYALT